MSMFNAAKSELLEAKTARHAKGGVQYTAFGGLNMTNWSLYELVSGGVRVVTGNTEVHLQGEDGTRFLYLVGDKRAGQS